VTTLARAAMRVPAIRTIVRTTEKTISGPRRLRTWNDLLYTFPGLLGVKTGHTGGAGWSQVAAARGPGFVVYATLLGEPTRASRNADLTRLLAWGISRFRQLPIVKAGRTYATTSLPYDKGRLPLVAARDQVRVVRLGKPLTEEVVVPGAVELPVARGQRLGRVRVYREGRLIASSPLVASRAVTAPGLLGRAGWYAGETVENVWDWMS
jgi:D-alanyl-D-alanine carboxypeptidase (penicillin-binding protein 5/6)